MERNYQEQEYAAEAATNRAKRRKLTSEGGFRYGYRGEVVPGSLQMKILSCDGGYHQESGSQGGLYGQENILVNDKSVYCTYKNRCNIILCHQGAPGESAFTVRKIIIKAPPRGYTSPIQEGMIFVAMEADDLLARTAQYQIREESPVPPTYANTFTFEDSDNETPIGSGSIRIVTNARPPSRRAEGTSSFPAPPASHTTSGPPIAPPRRTRMVVGNNGIRRLVPEDEDVNIARTPYETSDVHRHAVRRHRQVHRTNRYTPGMGTSHGRPSASPRIGNRSQHLPATLSPATLTSPSPLSQEQTITTSNPSESQETPTPASLPQTSASTPPPQQDKFNVTMDCSDLSDDEEELSSPEILADLYRRDRTLYLDHSSDIELESDDGDTGTSLRALREHHNARLGSIRGLGRRELPSRVQVVDLADVDDDEIYEGQSSQARAAMRAVAKEKGVLAPHARFFIEKEKSSVSVTFEPEVSGRYILLKLWSTTKGQNIDIQSVIVKGFAGPRFFPTAQFL